MYKCKKNFSNSQGFLKILEGEPMDWPFEIIL